MLLLGKRQQGNWHYKSEQTSWGVLGSEPGRENMGNGFWGMEVGNIHKKFDWTWAWDWDGNWSWLQRSRARVKHNRHPHILCGEDFQILTNCIFYFECFSSPGRRRLFLGRRRAAAASKELVGRLAWREASQKERRGVRVAHEAARALGKGHFRSSPQREG